LLGADAAIGRTFAVDDESTDAPRTILLSDALWQRRFGGDPSIVGRAIRINGQTTTVVGVMPAGFRLLMPPDAAVPDDLQAFVLLNPQALTRGPRGQQFLRVVGRMKRGVTSTASPRRSRASSRRTARTAAASPPSACKTMTCGRSGRCCSRCLAESRSCC